MPTFFYIYLFTSRSLTEHSIAKEWIQMGGTGATCPLQTHGQRKRSGRWEHDLTKIRAGHILLHPYDALQTT